MIIRTAASQWDIEQALDVCQANEPPMDAAFRAIVLAHWLFMYENFPEGFWVAEDKSAGQIVGVASAMRRPPQWALTNFYVLPDYQGKGIGRKLVNGVFSTSKGCERLVVHASTHSSAQSIYLQLGMYPQPYSIFFRGNPDQNVIPGNLTAQYFPVGNILGTLDAFDQKALGFTRAVDHQWWGSFGNYFLVKKGDQTVAYFRVSKEGVIGPLIVSDEQWTAPALDLAICKQKEILAAPHQVFVPGANRAAVAHLFSRGYRFENFDMFLSSQPMPGLAQVIFHDTDLL